MAISYEDTLYSMLWLSNDSDVANRTQTSRDGSPKGPVPYPGLHFLQTSSMLESGVAGSCADCCFFCHGKAFRCNICGLLCVGDSGTRFTPLATDSRTEPISLTY
jgi:hypothetical protein